MRALVQKISGSCGATQVGKYCTVLFPSRLFLELMTVVRRAFDS